MWRSQVATYDISYYYGTVVVVEYSQTTPMYMYAYMYYKSFSIHWTTVESEYFARD